VREEYGAMSDSGDERPPNRTVFRPSPLQARENRPATAEPRAGLPPHSEGAAAPVPPAAPPPRADDDIPAPAPAARARNPMMAAAAPVLALIAAVRSGRVQMPLPELHQKAQAAIALFDQTLTRAGYDQESRQRARYAVCATVDDVAQNLPGQAVDGAEWARRSMVVMAFNENIGGDRFWQLLSEMLAAPSQCLELLELYHACLAAGFEGRYRVTPDGKRQLHEILTRTYAALPHVRELSQTEIAPHWLGRPTPPRRVGFWAPLALAAGIAFGVLLLAFIGLRVVLMETGRPAFAAVRAINPTEPLRLSRAAAPPPPSSGVELDRLRTFLAPEIAQHLVAVEQDAKSVRVRTTVGQLFRSGSDALEPGKDGLFQRIGAAVETEKGPVLVEGHADSDRVASVTFPDNFALSKARAETVARIVRGKLGDPSRVSAEGFGDSQPIASNATAAGKALNRRVEIVLQRQPAS
jgi:type VI secretion system protein ImpK